MTSFIEDISNPWLAIDLNADSLPEPIPFTTIWNFLIPIFSATAPNVSAILEAAKGVDFFEPLNPSLPADLLARTFPAVSAVKLPLGALVNFT